MKRIFFFCPLWARASFWNQALDLSGRGHRNWRSKSINISVNIGHRRLVFSQNTQFFPLITMVYSVWKNLTIFSIEIQKGLDFALKFMCKTMEENLELCTYYWSRLGFIGVELPSELCCARILSQNLWICVKSLVGGCWNKSVQSVIYLGETPCQAWDLQQVPCGVTSMQSLANWKVSGQF